MSDSMNRPAGLVVGTAGHIDHGKTSLIRALTGIDTDRLLEEKRRGISIDLGFAYLKLPNRRTVSFVDVPGHERFIKNMLAGVGGIQAVMLVVAADESVMPQTREHFAICRLLGIRHGFVVLTKVDAASPELIEIAREDIENLCAGSFLEGAPIVNVSSTVRSGLESVTDQLARMSERIARREARGIGRLPVDRSFSLSGFGTVVTGTLLAGALHTGDTITIYPSRTQARIRSLQVHGAPLETVEAGQRCAVNLAGIESSEAARGCTLAHGGDLVTSQTLDAEVTWLPQQAPSRRRGQVLLHLGTAEISADFKLLTEPDRNSRCLVRLALSEPALALSSDRFILRQPSPSQTIGGGVIIDPHPPVRLNRSKTTIRLTALARADAALRMEILSDERANGCTLDAIVGFSGLSEHELLQLAESNPRLLFHKSTRRVLTTRWLGDRRTRLLEFLEKFHKENPSAAGAPIASARLGLEPELAETVFEGLPSIRVQGELVSLASHRASFSEQELGALLKIENAFRQGGYQPPPIEDAIRCAVSDQKKGRALLESLLKAKKLVKISDGLIFHSEVIAHVRSALSVHRGRTFSVPEFKDWTQMSRKYAIPVLEYLDREKVTRRMGDQRVVI